MENEYTPWVRLNPRIGVGLRVNNGTGYAYTRPRLLSEKKKQF